MKLIDRHAMSEDELLAAQERLTPGFAPSWLRLPEVVVEELNGLADCQLNQAHPLIGAAAETGVRPLHPLGYVELDPILDVYRVITLWSSPGTADERCELQLLAVAEDGRELLAYTDSLPDKQGRVRLDVQVDQTPRHDVMASVPIESRELVQPPDARSQLPAVVVIRLHAFDALACPIAQASCGVAIEPGRVGDDRELSPARMGRGILPGVDYRELVQHGIECGPQVVQPFTEQNRVLQRELCGGFRHDPYLVIACIEPENDRVSVQVFGSDLPHRISMRAGTFGPERPGNQLPPSADGSRNLFIT
ncbi:hypothetical protein [Rhodococcus jostii]|uniref:hypothetical protein n=1 Tax=Rhodococcus jostii TaxID=132919 RepID=UPI00362E2E27